MPNLCCYCKAIYTERGYNEDNPDPCPHCGRVWFEETDEAEREPTRKHIKAQKPIETRDPRQEKWEQAQELYNYLSDNGVGEGRIKSIVRASANREFQMSKARILELEVARTYQEKYTQVDDVPGYEFPDWAVPDFYRVHFADPEEAAVEAIDGPGEVSEAWSVINQEWKGTLEELVIAATIAWPGSGATKEQKDDYYARKRRLNRFRKRAESASSN